MDDSDYPYRVQFLRCHSRNNDPADVQTKVWQCAFEPNKPEPAALLATCGGNSLCIIEPASGRVRKKFNVRPNDQLLAFDWGTVVLKSHKRSVIVTGGVRSTLYVFDPDDNVKLVELQLPRKYNINALIFHPKVKNLFFCGSSDGNIRVCELVSSADEQLKIQFLGCIQTNSEIFCLTFDVDLKCLFSCTSDGLFVTHFTNFKSPSKCKAVELQLPRALRENGENLVDSAAVIGGGLVAVKYALHGTIYICDFNKTVETLSCNRVPLQLDVVKFLRWSNAENYYMNMGVGKGEISRWLGCGDDQGQVWLYDLKTILDSSEDSFEPFRILPWGILIDPEKDKKRKIDLDVYDIVVNKVAISSRGNYIAAVTNNNMVCLWKTVESMIDSP